MKIHKLIAPGNIFLDLEADDGTPIPAGDPTRLSAGDVGLVSPRLGDVHRVRNAHDDRVSISIHAYGADIGKVRRHVFPVTGGAAREFVSGYSDLAP